MLIPGLLGTADRIAREKVQMQPPVSVPTVATAGGQLAPGAGTPRWGVGRIQERPFPLETVRENFLILRECNAGKNSATLALPAG